MSEQAELKENKAELKANKVELKENKVELKANEVELKENKKELKQAYIDVAELQEYQLFVNTVKEYAIFFLDPQGVVTRWGPGAEKIYGYQANEAIGKHFSFLYLDEDAAQGWPCHNLKQAAEHNIYEEVRLRLRHGEIPFWANVVITPLHDETDGALLGFAKIVKDITEQKKLDEQLKQYSKDIEEKNRALSESNRDLELFATIAAHDLQAPIRKIGTFCELG
jgi:PAS domain S-box-containing protein